jgi:hypothetical protein
VAERFSASVASKHLACPASANLELAIPGYQPPPRDGDTKASIKGTDMHEILERAGEYSPKEMLGIAEAMTYVANLRRTRRFKQILEAEGEGWWLQGKPGTKSDVVLYVQDQLEIVDYKFGGIPVPAAGNDQGKYYALAFLPLAPKAKGVTFHVVQPFANNIDSVFFTVAELEQFRLDTIAAEQKILAGDTTFSPSDACTFCPANPHGRGAKGSMRCPAMVQLLYPKPPLDEDSILALA